MEYFPCDVVGCQFVSTSSGVLRRHQSKSHKKTFKCVFGEEFDKRYNELCDQAEEGLIKNYRITPAKELWKKMLKVLFGKKWAEFYHHNRSREQAFGDGHGWRHSKSIFEKNLNKP